MGDLDRPATLERGQDKNMSKSFRKRALFSLFSVCFLTLNSQSLLAQTLGASMQEELNRSELNERSSDKFWSDFENRFVAKIRLFDLSVIRVTFSQPSLAGSPYQEKIAASVTKKYLSACGAELKGGCNSSLNDFFLDGKFNGTVFNVVVTIALRPDFSTDINRFLSSGSKSSFLLRAQSEEGPNVIFSTDPTPDTFVEFRAAIRAPQKDTGAAVSMSKTGNAVVDRDAAILGAAMGAATRKAYTGYDLPDLNDKAMIARIFRTNEEVSKTERSIRIVDSAGATVPSLAARFESADLISADHYKQWEQDRYQVVINQSRTEEMLLVVPANQISKIDLLMVE